MEENYPFKFNCSLANVNASDQDGEIVEYEYTINDPTTGTVVKKISNNTYVHKTMFKQPISVTVRVKDDRGNYSSVSRTYTLSTDPQPKIEKYNWNIIGGRDYGYTHYFRVKNVSSYKYEYRVLLEDNSTVYINWTNLTSKNFTVPHNARRAYRRYIYVRNKETGKVDVFSCVMNNHG